MLAGVNGITPLTPALSVAAKADVMVFTAFEDNGGRVGQRHLTAALDRELRKLGRRGIGAE